VTGVVQPNKSTDTAPGTSEPPLRSRRPFAVLAVVSVLVLVGIGAWAASHYWLRPPPVVAYSSQDRRMTYAVLPLQVAADDGHAAQVAKATGNEILTFLEARHELVSVVSSASAEQAVAHESAMRKIAATLDVHFLIRGTVARSGTDYQVTVLCIDGESERVLATQTLTVAADELTPHWRNAVRRAVGELVFAGLELEAKRIRTKAPDELDVRDLSILANVDWALMRDKDGKAANARANELLKRALALAPDDLYALREVAVINLCDCVNSWSPNPDEQKAVGAAAMEKYLQFDPESLVMLYEKANLYQLRLRWEESIFIADTILAKEPNDPYTLSLKATGLLRLGRLPEARSIDEAVLVQKPDNWGALSSMANICYAQADYASAATMARKAVAQMSQVDLKDRVAGSVQLTLIAAEARLKHADRARQALTDFETVLPNAKGIAAIKAWLHPSADLADTPSLYEGLREAGVGD
jgi:tetratricopeptide (TPR) repeat protein/TolB-like protein